jgi:hypothetical protein
MGRNFGREWEEILGYREKATRGAISLVIGCRDPRDRSPQVVVMKKVDNFTKNQVTGSVA